MIIITVFILAAISFVGFYLSLNNRAIIDRNVILFSIFFATLWLTVPIDNLFSEFRLVIDYPAATLILSIIAALSLFISFSRERDFDRIFVLIALVVIIFTHVVFITVYKVHLTPSWLSAQLSERHWVFQANDKERLSICNNSNFTCINSSELVNNQTIKPLIYDQFGYSVWIDKKTSALFFIDKESDFSLKDSYSAHITLTTMNKGFSMLSIAATCTWMLLSASLISFHRRIKRERY